MCINRTSCTTWNPACSRWAAQQQLRLCMPCLMSALTRTPAPPSFQMERKVARAGGVRSEEETRALNARIEKLTIVLESVNSENGMLLDQVRSCFTFPTIVCNYMCYSPLVAPADTLPLVLRCSTFLINLFKSGLSITVCCRSRR